MSFTAERTHEMLSILVGKAIELLDARDLVEVYRGNKLWEDCFQEYEDGDGMTGVFAQAIRDEGDPQQFITDKEFDEIAKPFVAARIAEALGAKKVSIEW